MQIGAAGLSHASSLVQRRYSSAKNIQLVVSSHTFVFCWIGVQLLHVTSVLFLFFVGAVHLLISTPRVYRAVWLLRIAQQTLRLAGWSYLGLALIHAVGIARDVVQSIRFGRLMFAASKITNAKSGSVVDINDNKATASSIVDQVRLLKAVVVTRLRSLWRSVGVNGKNFPLLMKVRQGVEVASQVYQAFLFSRSVPRVGIIRILLALVVLNCTYMPFLRSTFKHRPGARLAAILAFDLVLDIACSTIVPLLIVVPRFLEFNWTTYSYPDTLRFNEEWLVMTLSEVRQVLATSTLDHVTTIVPYVAVIDSLHTLKAVLMRVADAAERPGSMTAIVAAEPLSLSSKMEAKPLENTTKPRRHCVHFRTFDIIMWATAVLVLSIHLHAEFRPANTPATSCKLLMKPWLAHNMSCAVFDYNCYRQGSNGSDDHVATQLNMMDRSTLMKVIFSHCASLSMPPAVTHFPKLIGIQTLNCTIATWPSTASVTQTSHSRMAEVQLFATNMSELPQGLLHGDLPTRLSLVIHRSNLTHFPEDAGDRWNGHVWPYLSIQRTPFQRLPSSFNKARAFYLTLLDTHLESIDDDTLADFELRTLRLSCNRFLSRLPANIGSDAAFRHFEAAHTNVSSLSPWLEDWLRVNGPTVTATNDDVVFTLYGSPICEDADTEKKAQMCMPRDSIAVEDNRYEAVKALRPL